MKHNKKSNTVESEKDCAQTPWWFIDSLKDFLDMGRFHLDVCCTKETAKAAEYYSLDDGKNGLTLPWANLNYCNPPFSNILPWITKATIQTEELSFTAMLMPDNPETKYVRWASERADTIIRMPFRLNFIKPDGTPFLDSKGRNQGPQFPCLVAWFTPLGLKVPTRFIYHDFREGFYK